MSSRTMDVASAQLKPDGSIPEPAVGSEEGGVREIVQSTSQGNAEVQDLLLIEYSVLYICNVCRNLFCSVAEVLVHKRVYWTRHECGGMAHVSGDRDQPLQRQTGVASGACSSRGRDEDAAVSEASVSVHRSGQEGQGSPSHRDFPSGWSPPVIRSRSSPSRGFSSSSRGSPLLRNPAYSNRDSSSSGRGLQRYPTPSSQDSSSDYECSMHQCRFPGRATSPHRDQPSPAGFVSGARRLSARQSGQRPDGHAGNGTQPATPVGRNLRSNVRRLVSAGGGAQPGQQAAQRTQRRRVLQASRDRVITRSQSQRRVSAPLSLRAAKRVGPR
ncbi:uncharacterized protein LOC144102605 [Amblyomma americanum]